MVDELYPSDFTGWSPAEESGGYDYNLYNIDNTPMQYVPGNNYESAAVSMPTMSGGNQSSGASWLSGLKPFAINQPSGGSGGGYLGGSGGGSRSYGGYGNQGSTQVTSYLANKSLPSFNLPTYDYGRVNFLANQQAAPQLSKLRSGLYTGIGKINATDNPYMQKKARQDLLQGYGGGISDVMQGATKTGEQLYGQEYSGLMTQAQAMFQAALQDYTKSMTTKTTTLPYADMGNEQSYADRVLGYTGGSVINPLYASGSEWERKVKNYLGG